MVELRLARDIHSIKQLFAERYDACGSLEHFHRKANLWNIVLVWITGE